MPLYRIGIGPRYNGCVSTSGKCCPSLTRVISNIAPPPKCLTLALFVEVCVTDSLSILLRHSLTIQVNTLPLCLCPDHQVYHRGTLYWYLPVRKSHRYNSTNHKVTDLVDKSIISPTLLSSFTEFDLFLGYYMTPNSHTLFLSCDEHLEGGDLACRR